FNVAVFRSKQNDVGVAIPGQAISGQPGSQAYRSSGDGSTVEGFEIELVGQIAEGLNLHTSYTQAEAKDASGAAMNTLHPRKQARALLSYQFSGTWQGLRLGAGMSWQSEIHNFARSPTGTRRVRQGSYALADLMARYRFAGGLQAQLNVRNLFDRAYYSQVGFYSQAWWGEPRNVQLLLSYAF
ncbi:MAG: TonB-dependent receptor domain-containing protein, partial [Parahaliea sp.]